MLLDIIAREMNHNDRWTAGGLSRIALILGFKQPNKDDESGLWIHPTAGKHHDKVMPAIVVAALSSYFKECHAEDMVISVSRIKRMLGPMLDQLKEDRMLDEHGPLAAQEMVDEIIDHLSKAIELSTQLLIDEGLPS
jgi:hypothetical protein